MRREKDDNRLVEELFLRVLNRMPTAPNGPKASQSLRAFDDDHAKLQAELAAKEKIFQPGKPLGNKASRPPVEWTPLEVQSAKSAVGAR